MDSLDRFGPDSFGQGGVRERPHGPTKIDETGPASRQSPEEVRVSAGKDGAVRPRWIPQNQRRGALAGAWTRLAAAFEVGAQSLPPTVETRPADPVWRGGSALQ